mmetsp:Transcript_41119/g.111172  ORF Transcript_41119/g.111172 Transcript_41119/m.111172 type:complete len:283 (-) Transcript_41119:28-876(-)
MDTSSTTSNPLGTGSVHVGSNMDESADQSSISWKMSALTLSWTPPSSFQRSRSRTSLQSDVLCLCSTLDPFMSDARLGVLSACLSCSPLEELPTEMSVPVSPTSVEAQPILKAQLCWLPDRSSAGGSARRALPTRQPLAQSSSPMSLAVENRSSAASFAAAESSHDGEATQTCNASCSGSWIATHVLCTISSMTLSICRKSEIGVRKRTASKRCTRSATWPSHSSAAINLVLMSRIAVESHTKSSASARGGLAALGLHERGLRSPLLRCGIPTLHGTEHQRC